MVKILVGLAGCGKSTYCETVGDEWVVVSSDAIRKEVFGDEQDQSHNTEVFQILHERIIENEKNGINSIYDATNLSRKKRMAFIKSLPKGTKVEAVVFATPIEKVLERNAKRERHVPEEAIIRMFHRFEPPHYDEGFETITIVDSEPNKNAKYELFAKLIDLPHDNPHHTYTVGGHCLSASDRIKEVTASYSLREKEVLNMAAFLHDFGKYYTKTFINMKGNKTEKAHYYDHEHVGAYLSLIFTAGDNLTTEQRIEIANLIDLHMSFYGGSGRIKNLSKTFNPNFMEKLQLIHEADLSAH